MSSPTPHRYKILATVMLTQMSAAGLFVYSFSVLQLPIAEEFGAPRSFVSLTVSGAMALGALIAPFAGRAIDRGPIRNVMLFGATALAAGFAAAAASSSLITVLVLYALASAVGIQCMGNLPGAKLVTSWFGRSRGRALGLGALGTSLGGLLAPPAMAAAVASFGWRAAIGGGGALSLLLLGPAILSWIRDAPTEAGRGTQEESGNGVEHDGHGGQASETPKHPLLGDRGFWCLAVVVGTINGITAAVISHLVPIAVEQGIEARAAAGLLSLLSLAAIAGKLTFSAIADRIDERWLMAATLGLLGCFVALLTGDPGPRMLAGAALLPGFALGGGLPLWGKAAGSYFGVGSMGRAMGSMTPVIVTFQIGAVQLLPGVYDRHDSYAPAYWVLLCLVAVALLALLTLRRPEPAG